MRIFVFCFLLLASLPAAAAAPAKPADQPIDISADQSLEWDQNKRTYTARGAAKATRGDFTISADLLTAYERDRAGAKTQDGKATEVWKLEAEGNVRLDNGTAKGRAATVYGDKGVYDIDQQVAVLTGENLHLVSGIDTVTAKDRFEYWTADNLAVARGKATVTRADKKETRKIVADEITTLFVKDKNGQLQAERAEAHGNVTIFTATDTATGDHGLDGWKKNKALLVGNVRLTRDKNQLEGDRAEVDMNTGQSRLLAAENNKGKKERVRGLIYPKKKDAP